ncbi:MAG: thiol reductase thioredoxin, partial [Burkholderiaceae bacterium]|nr:thiol reductase thioredoxin [Burkholderiaceae bacterium]
DEDETLRPKFEVAHIPTMIFYRDGKEIDRIVEVQTPSALKAFIDQCMTA